MLISKSYMISMVNSHAQNLYDLNGKFRPGVGEVLIREILSQALKSGVVGDCWGLIALIWSLPSLGSGK
jgi:hypothetical protein